MVSPEEKQQHSKDGRVSLEDSGALSEGVSSLKRRLGRMTQISRKVSDNPKNMSLNWRTKFYVRESDSGQCMFETLLTSI